MAVKGQPVIYLLKTSFLHKHPKWMVIDEDDQMAFCPAEKRLRCEALLNKAGVKWQTASLDVVSGKLKDGLLNYIGENPHPVRVGELKSLAEESMRRRHFAPAESRRMAQRALQCAISEGEVVRNRNHVVLHRQKALPILQQTSWIRNCRLLLENIQTQMPELEALQNESVNGHMATDRFYRYYHDSFKVYDLQSLTQQIVDKLRELLPGRDLNSKFLSILQRGTGKVWRTSHNTQWHRHTGPILEAFWHSRTMLEMAIRSGKRLKHPPTCLPTDWAAVLYLFNLR